MVNGDLAFRVTESRRQCDRVSEKDGNTVVYVNSRAQAERVCAALNRLSLSPTWASLTAWLSFRAYHRGCKDRAAVEKLYAIRKGIVVVATVAFGLGVDSQHVRAVVHFVSG